MGRFLLGFVVGAAIGAAVVIITSPRSGSEIRQHFTDLFNETLDVARKARDTHEQDLWTQFRESRTKEKSGARSQESE